MDSLTQAVRRQEFAIGSSRRREAPGYIDPEIAEIADHLSERGVLSAYGLDIIHAKLVELDHILFQVWLPCIAGMEMDNRLCIDKNRRVV